MWGRREAEQVLVAAQVDGVADDGWRRMKRLVQFIDREHCLACASMQYQAPEAL